MNFFSRSSFYESKFTGSVLNFAKATFLSLVEYPLPPSQSFNALRGRNRVLNCGSANSAKPNSNPWLHVCMLTERVAQQDPPSQADTLSH